MRILVAGDPIPWDRSEGGGKIAERKRGREHRYHTPLILTRVRSDETAGLIAQHIANAGEPTTVTAEHMSGKRETTGSGLEYAGKISTVKPAEYNANSTEMAVDQIIVSVSSVRALAGA